MDEVLRLRIGDMKAEANEIAKFIGVSVSALTRMALREKIEREKARMQKPQEHSATQEARS